MVPRIEEIEYWLAKEFDYRRNVVVPNVSWGLRDLGHECDLLVLRSSGHCAEIEIKRSLADLKADKGKGHTHDSPMIRELWFSIPLDIYEKAVEHIPERAGIMVFERHEKTFSKYSATKGWQSFKAQSVRIERRRQPKINTRARKATDAERLKLLELAHMRIWSMKRKISKQ